MFLVTGNEIPNFQKSGIQGLLTKNCMKIKDLRSLTGLKNPEFRIYTYIPLQWFVEFWKFASPP